MQKVTAAASKFVHQVNEFLRDIEQSEELTIAQFKEMSYVGTMEKSIAKFVGVIGEAKTGRPRR